MRYYIIAGEPSGDMHGANLITELKKLDPDAEFRFWGGDKMAAASETTPVKHYKETAIMGFTEVLKKLRTIKGFMRLCKADIAEWHPDAVVFIDYPGFNLKIAKWAKRSGFRTLYYIAPKVWAWREWRVKSIRKYVDKVFAIFPFEVEWFGSRGVDVSYVGNPLLDEVVHSIESNETKREKVIALVAGSRALEVKYNLPVMVEVMGQLPDYTGIVTGVDWLPREMYEEVLQGALNVRVEYGKTYEVMKRAEAALVTSGTATLETALFDVPQLVCYRGPSISMAIARLLLQGRIRWVSLVNIVMNRGVVTELLGNKVFTAESGYRELQTLLTRGGVKRETMLEDYKELRQKLGEVGASRRCAKGIFEICAKPR